MAQRPPASTGRARRWEGAALAAVALLGTLSLSGFTDRGLAGGGHGAPSLSCPATPYGVSESLHTYGSPANGQPLDVDVYLPVGDPQTTVPGVVLVHGGEWAKGNFKTEAGDSMTSIGDCLAENGYDAFSIDYAVDVTGSGSFPENLQDINSAIGWVKANEPSLNPAQLFILGTSAGGNLADLAGENAMGINDGLAGVISQSGPADLSAAGMGCASSANCQPGSAGAIVKNYLGCYDSPAATCTLYYANGTTQQVPAPTAYADASPTTSLSQTVPAPPYLLADSSDEIIPLAQATGLSQLLDSQCTTTKGTTSEQLIDVPGDQHALTYSDILAGPTLAFLAAVVGKTLPTDCTTASPLTGAAMAYDANASIKQIFLFGGCCTAGVPSAATDIYNSATGTWTPVTISGSSPPARVGAAFGYDPASGKLLLFGGEYLPGASAQPVGLDDTWEFTYQTATKTGTWTQVDGSGCLSTCTGAPPARYAAAADQAPHLKGLALFGGENVESATSNSSPTAFSDTWLWNGTWTQISPVGTPPTARYGAGLVYDGPHNADLLFGGDGDSTTCQASCLDLLADTWALTLNTTTSVWAWAKKNPATSPPARDFPAMASGASGAMLFGGMNGTTGTNVNNEQALADTWTWNGSTWSQACTTCTTLPPATLGASIAYQRATSQDLLFGGESDAAVTAPATTWVWNTTNWTAG
ncbi:MAG TPA: kelch repeat-containing protein [Streptosporangiaceae bacterium]|nr:kelch repeat-containing protein [Streptosporangiaceae bacterium]